MVKQRLQVDAQACRGCESCLLACSVAHEGVSHPSLARLAIHKDMAKFEFAIIYCHHCDEPPCLEACPAGAMQVDARGVVLIDDKACVRCGACAEACPYGAIFYLPERDRYIKCDLCAGRAEGPLCVIFCPVEVIQLASEEVVI